MVNPSIWGRSGWIFLIAIIAGYADAPGIDMQHNYNRFFYHLHWVLPCEICMSNYEEHFRRWPIDQYLKSRAALFRWLMIMYNEVQVSLNKKTKGPQELLHELFGPEEGERMMQRLVYEDPDANITVIKPFDSQTGGGSTNDRNYHNQIINAASAANTGHAAGPTGANGPTSNLSLPKTTTTAVKGATGSNGLNGQTGPSTASVLTNPNNTMPSTMTHTATTRISDMHYDINPNLMGFHNGIRNDPRYMNHQPKNDFLLWILIIAFALFVLYLISKLVK